MIFLGGSMPSLPRMVRWAAGEFGALPEGAGGAFEGADAQLLEFLAEPVPSVASGVH
jgi:hypothetical protein